MTKFKVGEQVYWYNNYSEEMSETIRKIVGDKVFVDGGFLYSRDLHKYTPTKPKKLKHVLRWCSLDGKKAERLAEIIREALEKYGDVVITVE